MWCISFNSSNNVCTWHLGIDTWNLSYLQEIALSSCLLYTCNNFWYWTLIVKLYYREHSMLLLVGNVKRCQYHRLHFPCNVYQVSITPTKSRFTRSKFSSIWLKICSKKTLSKLSRLHHQSLFRSTTQIWISRSPFFQFHLPLFT